MPYIRKERNMQRTQEPRLSHFLNSLVLELRDKYPSIRAEATLGNSCVEIELSKPDLKNVMNDAYPTALIDSFADICMAMATGYEVKQEYFFGKERKNTYNLPSDLNPNPVVKEIAAEFASSLDFNLKHYDHKGSYAWSC